MIVTRVRQFMNRVGELVSRAAEFAAKRPNLVLIPTAIIVGLLMARPMFVPGVIGYLNDWNIPTSPLGLWVWGVSDFSPWRPIEFGMPLAYPTDFYLKLGLGLFGLIGLPTQLIVAVFLTLCFAAAFLGSARLSAVLWGSSLVRQVAAGLLFVTSPALFDALVPGYVTFIFAYAVFPWIAIALLQALGGSRTAWYRYALFVTLSLAQIQFITFDFLVTLTILIGMRATAMRYIQAAVCLIGAPVLCYAFMFANLVGVATLIQTTANYSEHSWTALSAPGIFKAFMLVPSVYPFFDDSLAPWNILWRALAAALVTSALFFGFRSRTRLSASFAALLVLCLVFLHGPNPPLTSIMSWVLNLPPLALLRNINYIFALVSLLLSILIVAPMRVWRPNYLSLAILAFAVLWALPFLSNKYTPWLSPIPGPNPTAPIIGEANRTLVFPHLQVADDRRPDQAGVNPNSVETITPIFVRNTTTGILEASILDRLTDWQPQAKTFEAALRSARVNAVALETALDSTFPRYVNSYNDPWLFDAYRTTSFKNRLDASDAVAPFPADTTMTYRAPGNWKDVQTSRSLVALSGSIEYEIAMRAVGLDALFAPAEQIKDASSSWIGGFAQGIGSPDFVASPSDIREGAYLPLGLATYHKTADFHKEWVDPMASANWWLSQRLLDVPHPAVTDRVNGAMSVDVPAGQREIWLQYFVSSFGGSITVSGPLTKKTIGTVDGSLGEYRWLDLGRTTNAAPRRLSIRSDYGLNAVGYVAMLTKAQQSVDKGRWSDFTRRGRVEVVPNIILDESIPLVVRGRSWHPSLLLANLSTPITFRLDVKLLEKGRTCTVLVGRAILDDFTVRLDGRAAQSSQGDFFPLASAPCDADTRVLLNNVRLTAKPRTFRRLALRGELRLESTAGNVATGIERTVRFLFLPLAFPPLENGEHRLTLAYPGMFSKHAWSAMEDAQKDNPPQFNLGNGARTDFSGGQEFDITTTYHAVDFQVPLKLFNKTDHYLLTGSYLATKGSLVRFTILNKGNAKFSTDLPGDGKIHEFHFDTSTVPRATLMWCHARKPKTSGRNGEALAALFGKQAATIDAIMTLLGKAPLLVPAGATPRPRFRAALRVCKRQSPDRLYVYVFPTGSGVTKAKIVFSSVEAVAASLFMMEPGVQFSPENQPRLKSLAMDRYRLSNADRVVQYDQTFDKGWTISGGAEHYPSIAGFNLWVRADPSLPATIAYRTGVIYFWMAIFSLAVFVALVVLSTGMWRVEKRFPRD